jgi:hypothetical protein
METDLGPVHPQVIAVFWISEAAFEMICPLMLRVSQLRVTWDMLKCKTARELTTGTLARDE